MVALFSRAPERSGILSSLHRSSWRDKTGLSFNRHVFFWKNTQLFWMATVDALTLTDDLNPMYGHLVWDMSNLALRRRNRCATRVQPPSPPYAYRSHSICKSTLLTGNLKQFRCRCSREQPSISIVNPTAELRAGSIDKNILYLYG